MYALTNECTNKFVIKLKMKVERYKKQGNVLVEMIYLMEGGDLKWTLKEYKLAKWRI